jgi:alkylated DNA repair dioxygenase AlkB
VSQADERSLLRNVEELPYKEFEFHGFVGKRRTVSYGWHYDFSDGSLRKAEEIPSFLISLRQVAAEFAGTPATQLQQVLVTEYGAEASIGWHRDKAVTFRNLRDTPRK